MSGRPLLRQLDGEVSATHRRAICTALTWCWCVLPGVSADEFGWKNESLESQFEDVRNLTTMSTVMQFGDTDWVDEPIDDFEGNGTSDAATDAGADADADRTADLPEDPSDDSIPTATFATASVASPAQRPAARSGVVGRHRPRTRSYESAMVDSRDAKLQYLYWQYSRAKSMAAAASAGEDLKEEIDARRRGTRALLTRFALHSPAHCVVLVCCCVTRQPTNCSQSLRVALQATPLTPMRC